VTEWVAKCKVEIEPWSKVPGCNYHYHYGPEIREERVYDENLKKSITLQRWLDFQGGDVYEDGLNGRVPPLCTDAGIKELKPGMEVGITEGPPKAILLHQKFGMIATSNAMGGKAWGKVSAEQLQRFKGTRVRIFIDYNSVGLGFGQDVAESLAGIAAEIKVIILPRLELNKDLVDWFSDYGGTPEELRRVIDKTARWKPGTKIFIPQLVCPLLAEPLAATKEINRSDFANDFDYAMQVMKAAVCDPWIDPKSKQGYARCPNFAEHTNGDARRSFSFRRGTKGQSFVGQCHANCSWDAVRIALGLVEVPALPPDDGTMPELPARFCLADLSGLSKAIFDLARYLKGRCQTIGEVGQALRCWQQRAIQALGEQDLLVIESLWNELWVARSKVKMTALDYTFEEIFKEAMALPMPPEADRYANPRLRQLYQFVKHLQETVGFDPFILPKRTAADLLGVSDNVAWKHINHLLWDGTLQRVPRREVADEVKAGVSPYASFFVFQPFFKQPREPVVTVLDVVDGSVEDQKAVAEQPFDVYSYEELLPLCLAC
jgi:hypothetical protein